MYVSTTFSVVFNLIIPITGDVGLCAVVPLGSTADPVALSARTNDPVTAGNVNTLSEPVSAAVNVTEPPDEDCNFILPAILIL